MPITLKADILGLK